MDFGLQGRLDDWHVMWDMGLPPPRHAALMDIGTGRLIERRSSACEAVSDVEISVDNSPNRIRRAQMSRSDAGFASIMMLMVSCRSGAHDRVVAL